ncbi:LuxR family transcriptional regulator [Herbidospora sp. NBRC 101105]|uniref:helix-turn-helix transcriptional regulator n=1 Tax=Herbidospora sp. NBRC 101105 TaxID=3032195 RepID=UPI0024A17CBC|nr:LuxR family transcriptional regulator [Herbidospora sp. NBRC 101105]GLX98309.1 LuxR family transcriptional regulator [Herbidospora sp. NBRC 101105]
MPRSPVLIGREPEKALFDRCLEQVGDGHGRTVFLVGDPGMGKSRLTSEVLRKAGDLGLVSLRGRGSAVSADIPFKPLSEALFSLARSRRPPDDPLLRPYLPALTTLVPEWREEGGAQRLESAVILAEAVLRLLIVLGRESRGGVLVLEDLHDADPGTLGVVEYLADNLAGVPALLLVNLRGHAGPARKLADDCARRQVADVAELPPLSPGETRRLVAACRGRPDELPAEVLDRLVADTEGVPYLVEEFVDALDDDPGARGIAARLATLVPAAHELLLTGAVFGNRFPVPVIQDVSGLDDRETEAILRAATTARLVVPDEPAGEWYAFRHALTAEALSAELIPAERARLARQAARSVERLHPGLPGEWLQIAASLRLTAGEVHTAGALLAEAGERYLNGGAADVAATLLERADRLQEGGPAERRAHTLRRLLHALTEGGRADRALELVREGPSDDLSMGLWQEIDLRTKLAWVAAEIGELPAGRVHVAAVRRLLESLPDEARGAAIDVIEAQLLFPDHGVNEAGPAEMAAAEALSRRAAEVAERIPLPEVACQAWERLAMLTRVHGFGEPDRCLTRMMAIAEVHGLSLWRLRAMYRLAANHNMRTGESEPLEEVLRAATQAGAISLVHSAEASLVMTRVLRAEYKSAAETAAACVETTIRLGHTAYTQYLLMAQATLAAHQGRRDAMEHALAEFRRWGGEQSLHTPVVYGLCQAFCALLEEDREQAAELLERARAWEDDHPTLYYMTGRYGLAVLLGALAGELTLDDWAAVHARPAAELRWNRHFLLLARAVLLGRRGEHAAAGRTMAEARAAGEPFPQAAHLGARLVAEAALADGWGEPVVWLRAAEDHFHEAGVTAVTAACRTLLRQAGAAVSYRRAGREGVPGELRNLGVTVREHQVLLLLAERLGNVEIGRRLFISPRTVEKHVASLLAKTGLPNRAALGEHAAVLRDS